MGCVNTGERNPTVARGFISTHFFFCARQHSLLSTWTHIIPARLQQAATENLVESKKRVRNYRLPAIIVTATATNLLNSRSGLPQPSPTLQQRQHASLLYNIRNLNFELDRGRYNVPCYLDGSLDPPAMQGSLTYPSLHPIASRPLNETVENLLPHDPAAAVTTRPMRTRCPSTARRLPLATEGAFVC